MARLSLSVLSRRLRQALEVEHPAAQLDEETLQYLAGMLEGDQMAEEELLEEWTPFLGAAVLDEATTRDVCRAVIRRVSGLEVGAVSSRAPSPAVSRVPSAGRSSRAPSCPRALSRAPSSAAFHSNPEEQAHAWGVAGLMAWLERLHLAHHAVAARSWCKDMGVIDVSEVIENWEEFSEDLKLRRLEHLRVLKDAESRQPPLPPERDSAGSKDEVATASGQATRGGATGFGHNGHTREPSPRAAPAANTGRAAQTERSSWETFGPRENPYTILHELGAGATATVYKCVRGEEVFAVKAISLQKLRMKQDFAALHERLHRETEILSLLRHSNIVSLYEVVETREKLYYVMEYIGGGELAEHIRQHELGLPEHEARYIFLQIVLGLRYIHSRGVAHRDLKPENVLIQDRSHKHGLIDVKISDFGHSKLVDDGYSMARSRVGTPQYWAPEVDDMALAAASGYTKRVDLWSLGVLLYVMLEGSCPFDSATNAKRRVLQFRPDSSCSVEAQNLISSLVQHQPEERLDLDSCLLHPWVMSSSGPLSRMVKLCTNAELSKYGGEFRVPLPLVPVKDLHNLRKSLRRFTIRTRIPAMLRHNQVAVTFYESSRRESTGVCVEPAVAWDELMSLLRRHLPAGSFSPPALNSLESVPLSEETLSEHAEVSRANSRASVVSTDGEDTRDGLAMDKENDLNEDATSQASDASSGLWSRLYLKNTERHDENIFSVRKGRTEQSGKRSSLHKHLQTAFPLVSGFLSVGQPSLLVVEGASSDVEELVSEVRKYKWWSEVQEVYKELT
eukprot:CAMPEP_0178385604 /NCGR_PEP_ID=MMETSP0689_2-20121128/8116_1 /TAXON_ID=160604 /ORGANISM="Amphidinium massartii, Strain CS-259" /LENGTH=790 /DNA_ID=CAMNT_0020005887 /DNA_START=19 /DNA_END=2388 /DNA_ORIENTATION=-